MENEKDLEKNTADNAGKVDTQTTEKQKETEGKAFKTFQTEEEYNDAVKGILKSKLPPKEEMEAFKTWKENQKTEAEKQAEKETEYQNTLSKNKDLEKENLVLKANVNIADLDYVIFKVSKMEGEFKDNLKSFLTENPKYLNINKEEEKNASADINLGGNHQNGGSTDLSKMSYEEYKAYRKNNK